MGRVFNGNNKAAELVLRIILGRPFRVIHVKSQVEIRNAFVGGRSIRLDIRAVEENGDQIDLEVQGDCEGAHVRRARFYSSMLDTGMLKAGETYKSLRDSYVIFLYRSDRFGKGEPVYHIERQVTESKTEFGDGSHIIFVNGTYRGNDAIGMLIRDFQCKDVRKFHYPELAEGVKHYKETKEGQEEMCEAVEKYGAEREANGKQLAALRFLRNIMENTGCTLENAMDLLGIKGNERTALIVKMMSE